MTNEFYKPKCPMTNYKPLELVTMNFILMF